MLQKVATPELIQLRTTFVTKGFDLRFVGGCVRDLLNKSESIHDVDLCTDATPDEQITIYQEKKLKYFTPGISHGTVNILLKGVVYEITTLRTECQHDGRKAVVRFTRDWKEDLKRRDLTFNALSLTFDGELIDLFQGCEDLSRGRARFIGSPTCRIQEDYLRILRYFRFQAHFPGPFDQDELQQVISQASGLRKISRERVWMEMKKILLAPYAPASLKIILASPIAAAIDLPCIAFNNRFMEVSKKTQNPVTLLAVLLETPDKKACVALGRKWKWSHKEGTLAICLYSMNDVYRASFKHSPQDVQELSYYLGVDYPRQVMPITAKDLIDYGFSEGQELGRVLETLRGKWIDSKGSLSAAELLSLIHKHSLERST